MSTRSTTIVRSGDTQMIFFSRYEGYPSCLGKSLKRYLNRVKGWSIEKITKKLSEGIKDKSDGYVYKFAPDDKVHDCAEYVYVVDCNKETLVCYVHNVTEPLERCCIPERIIGIP